METASVGRRGHSLRRLAGQVGSSSAGAAMQGGIRVLRSEATRWDDTRPRPRCKLRSESGEAGLQGGTVFQRGRAARWGGVHVRSGSKSGLAKLERKFWKTLERQAFPRFPEIFQSFRSFSKVFQNFPRRFSEVSGDFPKFPDFFQSFPNLSPEILRSSPKSGSARCTARRRMEPDAGLGTCRGEQQWWGGGRSSGGVVRAHAGARLKLLKP